MGGVQFDLWPPHSDWVAPAIPEWDAINKPFAIDLETEDEGIRNDMGSGWAFGAGKILGVSASISGQNGVYLPVGHSDGNGPYTLDQILNWVSYQMRRASVVVGHNLGYDLGWLSWFGVGSPCKIFDTHVGASILNENRSSYTLDAVLTEYGFDGKDDQLLKQAARYFKVNQSKKQMMSNLAMMPAKYVGPYGERDASGALDLYSNMIKEISDQGMDKLCDVEMQMVLLALKMRKKGIRVDVGRATKLNEDWIKEQREIENKISSAVGFPVHPTNPDDLERLCRYEGVFDIPKTPKSEELSFTKPWMTSLHLDSFDWVVKWRNIQHSRNNYVEGIVLTKAIEGRVFPEINTVKRDDGGTVSGRISVNNPPLQQISARNPEIGPAVRSCFIPEQETEWYAFDYSQQEPRLSVHFAALTQITGAEDAVRYYANDPSADFHQMMSELSGHPRRMAKDVFLGMIYGQGDHSLSLQLEKTLDETKEMRGGFNNKVPWVSKLSEKCQTRAGAKGYIKTLIGRRCRFDLWEPYGGYGKRVTPLSRDKAERTWPNQQLRRSFIYKALNRLIQGSAADQMKVAMIHMYHAGLIPMLQMHDDVNFSIQKDDKNIVNQIEDIMLHSTKLLVPSKIDIEVGPNWGQVK